MQEQFDDLQVWLYVAAVEGGCGLRKRANTLWAENWEGRCCGEWDYDTEQGWTDFG